MTDKEKQKQRRIARRFMRDPVPPRVHRAPKKQAATAHGRERGDG